MANKPPRRVRIDPDVRFAELEAAFTGDTNENTARSIYTFAVGRPEFADRVDELFKEHGVTVDISEQKGKRGKVDKVYSFEIGEPANANNAPNDPTAGTYPANSTATQTTQPDKQFYPDGLTDDDRTLIDSQDKGKIDARLTDIQTNKDFGEGGIAFIIAALSFFADVIGDQDGLAQASQAHGTALRNNFAATTRKNLQYQAFKANGFNTTTPPVTAAPATPPVTAAPATPPVTAAPVTPPVTAAPATPPVTAAPATPPITAAPEYAKIHDWQELLDGEGGMRTEFKNKADGTFSDKQLLLEVIRDYRNETGETNAFSALENRLNSGDTFVQSADSVIVTNMIATGLNNLDGDKPTVGEYMAIVKPALDHLEDTKDAVVIDRANKADDVKYSTNAQENAARAALENNLANVGAPTR
ncbi:MAG: hypothetical protein ACRBCT_04690 [Alphaproteobacteria bacterium]